MRYTETRMTDVAMRLLEGIDENAVDFKPTYDGSTEEPVVLPANFPNLLANGSTGIAVGMATSIPPHNVAELCDAALHLIMQPQRRPPPSCMHFIPGPDFPTGGILVEAPRLDPQRLRDRPRLVPPARPLASARTRAAASTRSSSPKFRTACRSRKLVEKIAELLLAKKLPLLKDVRDESADDIRLVIEPRAGTVDPVILMEQLFKLTDLEQRIPLNMNVLDHGTVPQGDEPQGGAASPGSSTARTCWSAAPSTGSTRSPTGSKCSTATSSPTSTSTR